MPKTPKHFPLNEIKEGFFNLPAGQQLRAVSLHEGSKRGFFSATDITLQQLPTGQTRSILMKRGPPKVLDDLPQLVGRHAFLAASIYYYPIGLRLIDNFPM